MTSGHDSEIYDSDPVYKGEPPTVTEAKEFLEDHFGELESTSKKDQIVALWQRYYGKIPRWMIVEAVGCTGSYASKVSWSPNEGVSTWERESEDVSKKLRKKILERDNNECLKCGTQELLEIHHILRGDADPENLATLCRDCHKTVHGGTWQYSLPYQTKDEFWNLIDGE